MHEAKMWKKWDKRNLRHEHENILMINKHGNICVYVAG
jgi:hypothetical protein